MLKLKLIVILAGLLLLCMNGMAQASLTTIGTAGYDSDGDGTIEIDEKYNLIWDDDNNGNSVIWLDYRNPVATWSNQDTWAKNIDSDPSRFIINLDHGYSVTWNDAAWRLPSAGADPQTGPNQTSSEMGHLWDIELGFDAGDNPSEAQLNATDFDFLFNSFFWTGTLGSTGTAYTFYMANGQQYSAADYTTRYGMAIRSGQVSEVPVPGAIWLLGSGLIGLMGFGRKLKKA